MARFSQFAVASAIQAVTESGLDLEREDRTRIGVLLGNGNGGYPNLEDPLRTIVARGGMRMDPLLMPKALPNMAAAQISLQLGLKGYTSTTVTACAAGTQAVGEAADVIRAGRADVMVCGGTEAGISRLGLGAFAVMRAMSTGTTTQSGPAGLLIGTGWFCAGGRRRLLCARIAGARAAPRSRRLRGSGGYAACGDAYHLVAPCADGEGACRAMTWALADAGVSPGESTTSMRMEHPRHSTTFRRRLRLRLRLARGRITFRLARRNR